MPADNAVVRLRPLPPAVVLTQRIVESRIPAAEENIHPLTVRMRKIVRTVQDTVEPVVDTVTVVADTDTVTPVLDTGLALKHDTLWDAGSLLGTKVGSPYILPLCFPCLVFKRLRRYNFTTNRNGNMLQSAEANAELQN